MQHKPHARPAPDAVEARITWQARLRHATAHRSEATKLADVCLERRSALVASLDIARQIDPARLDGPTLGSLANTITAQANDLASAERQWYDAEIDARRYAAEAASLLAGYLAAVRAAIVAAIGQLDRDAGLQAARDQATATPEPALT